MDNKKGLLSAVIMAAQVFILAMVLSLSHSGAKVKADSLIDVTGTVTSSSGTGVGGVSVYATEPDTNTVDFGPVSTASNGSYDLQVSAGTYDFHFDPSSGSNLDGTVDSNVTVLAANTISVQLVPAPHTFSGVITDANSNPVPNLSIDLYTSGNSYSATTTTDSTGAFSLTVPSTLYSFRVEAASSNVPSSVPANFSVSGSYDVDLTNANVVQNIQLPSTTPVTIVTQDANGNPARTGYTFGSYTQLPVYPGSSMTAAFNVSYAPGGPNTPHYYTDNNGTAVITVFQNTSGSVCAYFTYPNPTCSPTVTVNTSPVTITVAAPALHTFSGVITDANGNPLSNLSVGLSTNGSGMAASVVTDSTGAFSLSVSPGVYSLGIGPASSDVPSSVPANFSVSGSYDVDLTNGNLTQNIQLPATTTVTILTQDASGNPAGTGYTFGSYTQLPVYPGSSMTAAFNVSYPPNGPNTPRYYTDNNGTAVVGVFQNTNVSVCGYFTYHSPTCSPNTAVGSNPVTITVAAPALHTFSGVITDANGNPLSNLSVGLTSGGSGTVASATTDSTGAFSITATPSTYSFNIGPASSSTNSVPANFSVSGSYDVDLTNGNLTQNIQLPSTIPVTIVTQDASGNPASTGYTASYQAQLPVYPGSSMTAAFSVSYAPSGPNTPRYYTDNNGTAVITVFQNTSGGVCAYFTPHSPTCSPNTAVGSNPVTVLFRQTLPIVTPSAPANLTAPSPTSTAPSLTWDSISGATSYNIYRNGTSIGSSTTASYTDNSAVIGTTYSYYVTAVNAAGESSPSNTISVQVTSSPPTITSLASLPINARDVVNFQITTTGNPTPTLTETGSLPTGLIFTNNGDGTATLSGQASTTNQGYYFLTITASSSAGTTSQNFVLSVSNAQEAPTFISPSTDTESYGVPFSCTINTTGDPIPTITKIGTLPTGVTLKDNKDGTATLSGELVSSSDSGTYNFTLQAKNKDSTATQSFTLTITKTPVIKKIPNKTATVGKSYAQTITSSGNPTPNLSVAGLPTGLSFQDNGNGTGIITGTPAPGTSGTYPVTITASNSQGNGTRSFTIKVN